MLAALAAGHGHISAGNAWLAAIDVSFVLVVMHARARRVRRLQASAMDGCVEALKVCSLGVLLVLATAAILSADRPVPIGLELWLLTAVAVCVVSVVPRLYESVSEHGRLDRIGGLPLFSPHAIDPRGWQFTVKHAIDRAFALVALIVLSPVLMALALAIRLSSPGPAIFRQRRVGRDGRVFELLKFRTMLAGNGERFTLRADVAPGGIEGADRRTRIGCWLRSSSVDELPQLVNVLRGEMSLIGPRPERPEFAEQFAREIQGYDDRHRVRSGITGWAQANGLRGQTSIADRVELDNHYINNWSPGLELRILALTLAEVARFRKDQPATAKQPAPATQPSAAMQQPAAKPALRLMPGTAEPEISGRRFSRIRRRGCGRWRCAHPGDARVWRLRSRVVARGVPRRGSSRRRAVSGR